jgi:4-hydroxy-3-methylbut-2-enyl diphosphate reductase
MKVIRSAVLGFCMGVRRAVDIACAAAPAHNAEGADKPVYTGKVITLGPLIHNPRILDELKKLGVEAADDLPPDLKGVTVIIRAHGVPPLLEQAVRDRGGRIIDATCPRVKKSQRAAREFENAGVRLFIAGEAGHAEIAGLKGYAPSCIIAGTPTEAETKAKNLRLTTPNAKTALIAQTTIDEQEYRAIGESIKKYFPDLAIINTICSAVTDRQNSLRQLLKTVDAVVIAGGRESANTRRLAAIAAEQGASCVLAESAADIPPDFLVFNTVGLCAGASSPDSVIDEIEAALYET